MPIRASPAQHIRHLSAQFQHTHTRTFCDDRDTTVQWQYWQAKMEAGAFTYQMVEQLAAQADVFLSNHTHLPQLQEDKLSLVNMSVTIDICMH
jgi:hypothetical protein